MSSEPLNILLADDEPEIILVVSTLLKRKGHNVKTAHNGEEALYHFEQHSPGHFQILITDNNMPKMSGIDLVKRLRQDRYEGAVIILSGSLTVEMTEIYAGLNVSKIIEKPFTLIRLIETLDTIIGSLK